MTDVDHHDAPRRKAVADEGEELQGRQVERDVGLAIGIDDDHVVLAVGPAKPWPRVLVVHGEIRIRVHVEVAVADLRELGVDLDSIDLGPREEAAISTGGDRKSTCLNSSHQIISYAVFCLKKKKT